MIGQSGRSSSAEPSDAGESPRESRAERHFVTRYQTFARARSFPIVVSLCVLIALYVAGALALPGFATISTGNSILILASFLGIAAIGESLVVLLGGIDLSIPYIMGMSTVMAAQLTDDHLPFAASVVVTLVAGTLVGCFNGFVSQWLHVHPLIITLGVGYAVQAAVEIWTKGAPAGIAPAWLGQIVSPKSRVLGLHIAPVLIIWIVFALLVIFALGRSTFGRRVYAVGTNPVAASLSLISPLRVWTATFGISGFFAALAGILLLGFTSNPVATIGDPYLFLAVGAVVVGGTSLVGGRGGYTGTVIGAVLITVLQAVLVGVGFSDAVQQMLVGVIIVLAVALFGREPHVRTRV